LSGLSGLAGLARLSSLASLASLAGLSGLARLPGLARGALLPRGAGLSGAALLPRGGASELLAAGLHPHALYLVRRHQRALKHRVVGRRRDRDRSHLLSGGDVGLGG